MFKTLHSPCLYLLVQVFCVLWQERLLNKRPKTILVSLLFLATFLFCFLFRANQGLLAMVQKFTDHPCIVTHANSSLSFRVTIPTPWISSIVAVPKKDRAVCICADIRIANTAIKRVRHLIPIVEDVSYELNGTKFFSKLDSSQAYHQLELDE